MDAIVGQLLIVYSIKFFLVITAFPYFAQFLQYFLHKIVWKIFVLRFLDFLNPKLGRNDHCTMPKDSFCRCFGLRFCLDQVKFQLFCLSQIFQNSLQKNADLSNFRHYSELNFQKICQETLMLFEKTNILILQESRMSWKQNS